jgi:hypothetical protein
MTHGNGLPLALFSWEAAFHLERRRRRVALKSHGISSAARRVRTKAEARGCGPGGIDGGPTPAADNPHVCSGKSLVSGLRAAPLPSSGRTHLAVRLTVGDPSPSPVSGLKNGKPRRHFYREIRISTRKMRAIYQRNDHIQNIAEGIFAQICNQERIPLGFALIRGPEPAVLPVTRIVRY